MSFIDDLRTLAARIRNNRDVIKNEEGTKQSFIMPFIHALGYDPSDPHDVSAELGNSTPGSKKAEKVDYAVQKDGQPIILFECKCHNVDLNHEKYDQLFKYYSGSKVRFAILTNGIDYWFFADINRPNVMDERPFLKLNILEITDSIAEEVSKFSKASFNEDELVLAAKNLKYKSEIQRILGEEFSKPSDDFVKVLARRVYKHKLNEKMIKQFTDVTKQALKEYIDDKVDERYKRAKGEDIELKEPQKLMASFEEVVSAQDLSSGKNGFTQEEIQAYYIIRAILWQDIDEPNRLMWHTAKTYRGILLDDNTHKPICKFWFDGSSKSISLFDGNKTEIKEEITDLNDIFKYSEKLKASVANYESNKSPVEV